MALDHGQLNTVLKILKSGNPNALDAIYITIGGRMFSLARGIVKTREDAEDVLQESFLKIAKSIRSYREDTNAYAWVMRIVRNTAFDLLRRRKIRVTEDIDLFFSLADERYSPEKRETALVLEEAVKRLDEDERKMIYYKYYLDFTVRETASETGISKSQVQRLTASAEKKLKSLLGKGQIDT